MEKSVDRNNIFLGWIKNRILVLTSRENSCIISRKFKYLCKDSDKKKIYGHLFQRARVGVSLVKDNHVESFFEFVARLCQTESYAASYRYDG